MNRTAYEKAKLLVEKYAQGHYIIGGVSDDEIKAAEKYLELEFPDGLKQYFRDFGALSFYSEAIAGMLPGRDLSYQDWMNCVWAAADERNHGMPDNLIPLYDADDGEIWCLKK